MQLLSRGVKERYVALSLVHKVLSDAKTSLSNVKEAIDSSPKTINMLETSLNEVWKG